MGESPKIEPKGLLKQPLFLYVHLPFCLQKCKYCGFSTTAWKNQEQGRQYINLLKKELVSRGKSLKNRSIQSIYFGGGTPSLLHPSLFKHFISYIQNYFSIENFIEITMEVNPGTLSSQKINQYLEAGVNRFSIGVQTFSNPLLRLCGREHTSAETRETLKLMSLQKLNFSCDLLFALPRQSLKSVQTDLDEILSYSPQHLSAYCLTLPPHHLLQNRRPSDLCQIKMFQWIEEKMLKHHYIQYEISNFAKKGFESKHNKAYWTDQEFWGLGISSHSYLKSSPYGVRFWNPKNQALYQEQIQKTTEDAPFSLLPEKQVEFLTYSQALSDYCHTSLRTSKGIQKYFLQKKFGAGSLKKIQNTLIDFEKRGLVIQSPAEWKLNFQGRMLSNQVFSALIF